MERSISYMISSARPSPQLLSHPRPTRDEELEKIYVKIGLLPPNKKSTLGSIPKEENEEIEQEQESNHDVVVLPPKDDVPSDQHMNVQKLEEAVNNYFEKISPNDDKSNPNLTPKDPKDMDEYEYEYMASQKYGLPRAKTLSRTYSPLVDSTEGQEFGEEEVQLLPMTENVPSIQHMVSVPVGKVMDMQQDSSWMISIEVMLGALYHGEVQACSISDVPDELREVKEDAFKPKHISIGPLHREATRHIQLMEEPKWHYTRGFLGRQGTIEQQNKSSEERLKACGIDIHKLHKVICASYGGSNKKIEEIDPHEITKIMIVDGCFLLELLIRLDDIENHEITYSNDSILKPKKKLLSILNDVAMLENQIPFIVLKKLYRKVFPDGSIIKDDYRVANIVRKAFGYPLLNSSGGVHILNLMHLSTVERDQQHEGKKAKLELLSCATRLRASGVIIRAKLNRRNQNQHKWVDIFDFDISFNDLGELKIPPIYIKETTEVRWRNLIAWEQSKIWNKCKYTSYALFFKGLICCEHDIELLKKKGVIVNGLKKMSNKDLLTLFRTISKGAENMDLSYSEICDRLNLYDRKGIRVTKVLQKLPIISWHKCRQNFDIVVYYGRNWYDILIRDHIPTVWKFIGIVAAALLIVLTIMQTYYSARSS